MKTQIQLKPNSNNLDLDKLVNKIDKIKILMDISHKMYINISITKCLDNDNICSAIVMCEEGRRGTECEGYTGISISDMIRYINQIIIEELKNVYGDINV